MVVGIILWGVLDNFRRRDLGGWAKASWFIVILFIPVFGVLCYVIARPADAG